MVVVLAAGQGSRFGGAARQLGHKLAQVFAGSTVIGSTLSNVLRSGLSLVVVTTEELQPLVAAFVPPDDVVLLPAVGITAALWLGPAQEYSRYWLAGGDAKLPRDVIETFASAAWTALRTNNSEERKQ